MSFWRENSNVVEISPKNLTFKIIPPLQLLRPQLPSQQLKRQPPQPPKRLQQQQSNLRGAGGKDQRNVTATTKQKEQNKLKEEINGTSSSSSTTAFLMDQHYHDDTTAMASNEDGLTPNSVGLYCTSEAEDEESDNEIQERSPLFKPPSERLQWQDSPLQ